MSTNNVDTGALARLRSTRHLLSKQQYRTLRGQILAGDSSGAMKGLRSVLRHRTQNKIENT